MTTTFTVPADAAPEGALWLSFSDMGLADDANGYIDDVVLVRSDSKSTLKTTAFTPTVAEGETASAYVELDGQPAAKEVSVNKNATVDEVATALKTSPPHRTQTEPSAFLCSRTCRFDAHLGTQTGRTCCCCVAAPSRRCAVTMSLPSGECRRTRNGPAANHATGPFLNAGPRRLNP